MGEIIFILFIIAGIYLYKSYKSNTTQTNHLYKIESSQKTNSVTHNKASKKPRTTLDELWHSIQPFSHKEFRFLSPYYSPSSRMPCADFTSFIVYNLEANRLFPIKELMKEIISQNPGLGSGSSWIEKDIEDIHKMDLSKYCICDNNRFYSELKALFILASLSGGARGFWILDDEMLLLFSMALAPYSVEFKDSSELMSRASKFIKKMSKNAPIWNSITIMQESFNNSKSNLSDKLLSLPIGTRIHLFYIAQSSTLPVSITSAKMRKLGINHLETQNQITSTGLCVKSNEVQSIGFFLGKNDLIMELEKRGIEFKKSWNKEKLILALQQGDPHFIDEIMEKENFLQISALYKDEFNNLLMKSQALKEHLKLLCFV